MFVIDKLAYSSRLRDKNPVLKMVFAIGALVICVAANSILTSTVILIAMGYLTVNCSRVSLYKYVKLMMLPLAFLLMSCVAIIFDISNENIGVFSIKLGNIFVVATRESLIYAVKLIGTSISAVSCLYMLSLTTPMIDIIGVFRLCKMPKLIVEITLLMYRFIFLILDMAMAITISQNCRLGNMTFRGKIKSFGMMMSVVLVRALNKSNKLFEAMEARAYDGDINVLWEYERCSMRETVLAFTALSSFLIIGILSKIHGV